MNNEFVAYPVRQVPKDIRSALEALEGIVKEQNNADLLVKVGAIQGTYAAYERTGDIELLEQIVVDIVVLTGKLVPAKPFGSNPKGPFSGRNDLIYMQSIPDDPEYFVIEDLIEDYLKDKGCEGNTYNSYRASHRNIFKNKPASYQKHEFQALLNYLDEARENRNFNHNIRSAAGGFRVYLRRLYADL